MLNFKVLIFSAPSAVQNEMNIFTQMLNLNNNILLHFRRKIEHSQDEYVIEYLSHLYPQRIVLHQNYQWAEQYPVKGIHLPQKEYAHYEKWHKKYRIISTSFHTLDEIQNNIFDFEYVFLSPIFQSISKKDYKPVITQKEIKNFLSEYKKIPIIALGGCMPKHIPFLQELGFMGVAFLGAVWEYDTQYFIEQLQTYL